MKQAGHILEKTGGVLTIIGAVALAAIFLLVLLNGSWPEFLSPVQSLFKAIASVFGSVTFIVKGWLFLGPGLMLRAFGTKLREQERSSRLG